jgi:hypothetical protein
MKVGSRCLTLVMSAVCALSAACSVGEDEALGSDEATDFEVDPDDGKGDGISAVFDRNAVVSDAMFTGSMTVEDVQLFFERSPYKTRSWLADYRVGGKSAAQLVVEAAAPEGIHPLMLLTRMQVEASLVSKTSRPSQYRIDRALGCGCPDGSGCSASYRGFGPQLVCGAKILHKWFHASMDGTGAWRKGTPRRTLDPLTITPSGHATASLYAYTPWVLVNQGGNWLVWNVTRKYVRHLETLGIKR